MSQIQFDVIMTSLPVEVLLFTESSPEQISIILLLLYKYLERFLDKEIISVSKKVYVFLTSCIYISCSKHVCFDFTFVPSVSSVPRYFEV